MLACRLSFVLSWLNAKYSIPFCYKYQPTFETTLTNVAGRKPAAARSHHRKGKKYNKYRKQVHKRERKSDPWSDPLTSTSCNKPIIMLGQVRQYFCSEMHDFFLLGGPIVGEGFIVTFVCLVETGFVVASMKLRVFFFANSIRVA